MSVFEKFIFPTLVAIVAGLFLFYFQQDKPDVRYSLSQQLPLNFAAGGNSENVQLIEVKNVGKSEAQGILVKSDKKVVKFEIQKNSRSDVVESPKDNGPFEVKYATLPPGGNFKIILMSAGEGLVGGDFSITHSKGKASDAFSSNKGWIFFLFWGMMGFAAFFMLLSMKEFASQRWESRITYDADKVLKTKKPFFINHEKWRVINKEAWEWKLSKDIQRAWKLDETSSLKALAIDKPLNLDEEMWNDIRKKAAEIFVTLMKYKASNIRYSGEVIKLIDIEKPKYLSKDDWEEIGKSTEIAFRLCIKDELNWEKEDDIFEIISTRNCKYNIEGYYLNLYFQIAKELYEEKLVQNLQAFQYPLHHLTPEKLKYVKNNDEVYNIAYKKHYETVAKDLRQAFHPLNFIEETDWSVLTDKDVIELKKRSYQKELLNIFPSFDHKGAEDFLTKEAPSWVEDSDLKRITKIAEDILELKNNKEKSSTMLNQLAKITSYVPVGDIKPEILDDDDWQKLQLLERDIVKAKREIDVMLRRNTINSKRISDIKNKLTLQLRIINEVLNDPTAVGRIENYNNVFATGNFENLKKVASLLSAGDEKEVPTLHFPLDKIAGADQGK